MSTRYGWLLVSLAMLYYGYEFILRLLPRVFFEDLVLNFALTPIHLGLIASIYYYSYGLTQLIAGPALDKWGPRLTLGLASLSCALSLAWFISIPTFTTFCLSRLFIGVASAFAFIGILKTADLYLPARYNSFIAGVGTTFGMFTAQMGSSVLTYRLYSLNWLDVLKPLILAGTLLSLVIFVFFSSLGHSEKPLKEEQLSWKAIRQHILTRSTLSIGIISAMLMMPTQMLEELYGGVFCQSLGLNLSHYQISSLLGYIYYGWIVAGPIWGALLIKAQARLRAVAIAQSSLAFILLILIALALKKPAFLTITLVRFLFFILGAVSAVQVVTFALACERTPKAYRATAAAVVNCLISLVSAVLPNFLSCLQQLLFYFDVEQSRAYIYSLTTIVLMLLISSRYYARRLESAHHSSRWSLGH